MGEPVNSTNEPRATGLPAAERFEQSLTIDHTPRATLTSNAPGFVRASASRPIRPFVSSFSGVATNDEVRLAEDVVELLGCHVRVDRGSPPREPRFDTALQTVQAAVSAAMRGVEQSGSSRGS